MNPVFQWCLDHYQGALNALIALVGAARLIVKLLPSPKPATRLEAAVTWLKHLGLHIEDPKP